MSTTIGLNADQLALKPGQEAKFGKDLVHFRHDFIRSGLFGDDRLAELVDRYSCEYYMIATMHGTGECPEWRNGDFNGASRRIRSACYPRRPSMVVLAPPRSRSTQIRQSGQCGFCRDRSAQSGVQFQPKEVESADLVPRC